MPAGTALALKTVVIADDTPSVRERFHAAVTRAGHHAIAVRTGRELLSLARQSDVNIDLVVLDLSIPQSHGLELVKALRKIDTFAAPILVFSGTVRAAGDVRQLADLGIAGYVNEHAAGQQIAGCLTPHLFRQGPNRRASRRAALTVPISYRVGNTLRAALTLNLSERGVALRATTTLAPETTVNLRFRIPATGQEIEADAVVARVDRLTEMALEFTRVDRATQQSITAFVEGHALADCPA